MTEDVVADPDVEEEVVTEETIVDAEGVVLVPRKLTTQTLVCDIIVESRDV